MQPGIDEALVHDFFTFLEICCPILGDNSRAADGRIFTHSHMKYKIHKTFGIYDAVKFCASSWSVRTLYMLFTSAAANYEKNVILCGDTLILIAFKS